MQKILLESQKKLKGDISIFLQEERHEIAFGPKSLQGLFPISLIVPGEKTFKPIILQTLPDEAPSDLRSQYEEILTNSKELQNSVLFLTIRASSININPKNRNLLSLKDFYDTKNNLERARLQADIILPQIHAINNTIMALKSRKKREKFPSLTYKIQYFLDNDKEKLNKNLQTIIKNGREFIERKGTTLEERNRIMSFTIKWESKYNEYCQRLETAIKNGVRPHQFELLTTYIEEIKKLPKEIDEIKKIIRVKKVLSKKKISPEKFFQNTQEKIRFKSLVESVLQDIEAQKGRELKKTYWNDLKEIVQPINALSDPETSDDFISQQQTLRKQFHLLRNLQKTVKESLPLEKGKLPQESLEMYKHFRSDLEIQINLLKKDIDTIDNPIRKKTRKSTLSLLSQILSETMTPDTLEDFTRRMKVLGRLQKEMLTLQKQVQSDIKKSIGAEILEENQQLKKTLSSKISTLFIRCKRLKKGREQKELLMDIERIRARIDALKETPETKEEAEQQKEVLKQVLQHLEELESETHAVWKKRELLSSYKEKSSILRVQINLLRNQVNSLSDTPQKKTYISHLDLFSQILSELQTYTPEQIQKSIKTLYNIRSSLTSLERKVKEEKEKPPLSEKFSLPVSPTLPDFHKSMPLRPLLAYYKKQYESAKSRLTPLQQTIIQKTLKSVDEYRLGGSADSFARSSLKRVFFILNAQKWEQEQKKISLYSGDAEGILQSRGYRSKQTPSFSPDDISISIGTSRYGNRISLFFIKEQELEFDTIARHEVGRGNLELSPQRITALKSDFNRGILDPQLLINKESWNREGNIIWWMPDEKVESWDIQKKRNVPGKSLTFEVYEKKSGKKVHIHLQKSPVSEIFTVHVRTTAKLQNNRDQTIHTNYTGSLSEILKNLYRIDAVG
jgi:hypothetical protein